MPRRVFTLSKLNMQDRILAYKNQVYRRLNMMNPNSTFLLWKTKTCSIARKLS